MPILPRRLTSVPVTPRRGQALVGLLVVGFLLIVLYMMFLGPKVGKNGETQHSVLRQSMDRGQDVALNSNISQINIGIGLYKDDHEGKLPATLDEFKNSADGKGYPAEMYVNPLDKKPLVYDPNTGKVSAQTDAPPGAPGTAGSSPTGSNPGTGASSTSPAVNNPAAPGGVTINIPKAPDVPNEP